MPDHQNQDEESIRKVQGDAGDADDVPPSSSDDVKNADAGQREKPGPDAKKDKEHRTTL